MASVSLGENEALLTQRELSFLLNLACLYTWPAVVTPLKACRLLGADRALTL